MRNGWFSIDVDESLMLGFVTLVATVTSVTVEERLIFFWCWWIIDVGICDTCSYWTIHQHQKKISLSSTFTLVTVATSVTNPNIYDSWTSIQTKPFIIWYTCDSSYKCNKSKHQRTNMERIYLSEMCLKTIRYLS